MLLDHCAYLTYNNLPGNHLGILCGFKTFANDHAAIIFLLQCQTVNQFFRTAYLGNVFVHEHTITSEKMFMVGTHAQDGVQDGAVHRGAAGREIGRLVTVQSASQRAPPCRARWGRSDVPAAARRGLATAAPTRDLPARSPGGALTPKLSETGDL